jgi:hypothetical protein
MWVLTVTPEMNRSPAISAVRHRWVAMLTAKLDQAVYEDVPAERARLLAANPGLAALLEMAGRLSGCARCGGGSGSNEYAFNKLTGIRRNSVLNAVSGAFVSRGGSQRCRKSQQRMWSVFSEST